MDQDFCVSDYRGRVTSDTDVGHLLFENDGGNWMSFFPSRFWDYKIVIACRRRVRPQQTCSQRRISFAMKKEWLLRLSGRASRNISCATTISNFRSTSAGCALPMVFSTR